MSYQSTNSFTVTTFKSFNEVTSDVLEQSPADASRCFEQWKSRRFVDRAVVLHKAAALLRANVDAFARLATMEMGKRITEARGEVSFSANIFLDCCAEPAEESLTPHKLDPPVGEPPMGSTAPRRLFKLRHEISRSTDQPDG